MTRRPPRSTLFAFRRQRQMCIRDSAVVAPAVPALATLRLVGQRHQEQVGLLQRLQHGGAVGARHQG
ncbi:hypothetical protein, partial [Delftia sp. ASV31]|uniref:hypothetical protein n=1 Tax=Delftia sp. ASV31 TaxID=2795113 RepID=UPI001E29CF1C